MMSSGMLLLRQPRKPDESFLDSPDNLPISCISISGDLFPLRLPTS